MNNEVYQKLKDIMKKNHGLPEEGTDEHTEFWKEYNATIDAIKEFDGKKVKMKYSYSADWLSGTKEKIGKIKVCGDKILFFEGRRTVRCQYLDAGIFEGCFATIIPMTIEEV